ncbi:MAG: hypothetical protein KDA56_09095 [Hyphomonas sp.]|nr:hypothetical protein [Hyphomonas sp.]
MFCWRYLIRSLLVVIALVALAFQSHAESWIYTVDRDAIDDEKVGSANQLSDDTSSLTNWWALMVFCREQPGGTFWSVLVKRPYPFSPSIPGYSDVSVTLRIDQETPRVIPGYIVGGDATFRFTGQYENEADRQNITNEDIKDLIAELKSANKVAIRINGETREFSMSGSAKALSALEAHCGY